MKSGLLSLVELYKFVDNDPHANSLHGNSKEGRAFGKLAQDITSVIDNEHGFYLWGKYEDNGLWRNIYLGKAGYGKTACLRARILEELKDERILFWYNENNCDYLYSRGKEFYPNMWHKYSIEWDRSARKAGTSHILWITTPELDNKEVISVEADLIETLNPIANRQRPAPTSALQTNTVNVIRQLKYLIHENR